MFDGSSKNPQYYFSDYGIAVENGFQGSEKEWLASLVGPPGKTGKTAYEYAVAGGYIGTEEEFMIKLASEGKSAYEYARENGYKGSEADFGKKMAALDIRVLNGKQANKEGILDLVPADLGAINKNGDSMLGQLQVQQPGSESAAVPKSYADAKANQAKNEANQHANSGDSSTLSSANAHADSAAAGALSSAKNAINGSWEKMTATLRADSWVEDGLQQRVSIPGLGWETLVIASPDAKSRGNVDEWRDADVWAYKQEPGYLYFWALDHRPIRNLEVNIAWFKGA